MRTHTANDPAEGRRANDDSIGTGALTRRSIQPLVRLSLLFETRQHKRVPLLVSCRKHRVLFWQSMPLPQSSVLYQLFRGGKPHIATHASSSPFAPSPCL